MKGPPFRLPSNRRKSGVKQSTDVRFSDRGYAYARVGNSDITGLVPSYFENERPRLNDVPPGVLIRNKTTNCLELSDPKSGEWISFCFDMRVGIPTDGTFADGALPISEDDTIADAIDAINEYLVNIGTVVQFASHLGTSDGTTNGVLVDPIFNWGRVSSPNLGEFLTNGWDDNTNRDITTATDIQWKLEVGSYVTNLHTGFLQLDIIDGSGATIAQETLYLDGTNNNQASLPNGFIEVKNLSQKLDRMEGEVEVNAPIEALLAGDSGYLKIKIKHVIGSTEYSNPSLEFFRDSKGDPEIFSSYVELNSAPIKYLSGVKFATISGSNYPNIEISLEAGDVWADTYRADPLVIDGQALGIGNYTVNINSPMLTKEGMSPPQIPFIFDEDFIYSEDKNIEDVGVSNPDSNGNWLNISATIRDPFHSNLEVIDIDPAILINTHPKESTDNQEFFYDEEYRLKPSSINTGYMTSIHGIGRGVDAFDSEEDLNLNPSLQVINGRLIYPNSDWSGTKPTLNPDYSALGIGVGDLSYTRRFRDINGLARSNGVLKIEGLSEIDRINKNILIAIRVVGDHQIGNGIQGPGNEGTGWLSLNEEFNAATFTADDGDGCLIWTNNYSAPYFEFTLGGFSTAFAHNEAIELRVTFKDPQALNSEFKAIEVVDWTG